MFVAMSGAVGMGMLVHMGMLVLMLMVMLVLAAVGMLMGHTVLAEIATALGTHDLSPLTKNFILPSFVKKYIFFTRKQAPIKK